MSQYLRMRWDGAKIFFTVRLLDRNSDLFLREIHRLREATRKTRQSKPFEIDEIVVLPAVIHTIWSLPEADRDFSSRWRMLKSHFSRGLPARKTEDPRMQRRRDKGIWQRRFWEHHLRDAKDLEAHRHMILTAPVMAGLVSRPQYWPYSSVHRAIKRREFDPDGPVGNYYSPTPSCRTPLRVSHKLR